jgi:tetratricopeptide (TPR) repeat protein
MANEFPNDDGAPDSAGANPAALHAALAGSAASTEEARAFLRQQERLTKLQVETQLEQNAFEVSHLRWRRFNDQMKGALQIMFVAVGALIVVALAAAIWNASHASGLVVDSFTAPPDFEQRGSGGGVIAGDITNRLAAIRKIGVEHSYSSSSEVTKNDAGAIKVEIPDTGVSITEAWRYLCNWLGHERHLTGSLRNTANGELELSADLGDGRTITETDQPGNLAKLEQKVAEEVYQSFDPVNYVNYLSALKRHQEAYEAAASYVKIAKGDQAQADSYGLWSYTTADATGDIPLAIRRARVGITIDPKIAVLYVQEVAFDDGLGHDEDELKEAQAVLRQRNQDQLPAHRGNGFAAMQSEAHGAIALLLGDFADAEPWYCDPGCPLDLRLSTMAALVARTHDVAGSHALLLQASAAGFVDDLHAAEARYFADMETENWSAALTDAMAARTASLSPSGDLSPRFLATIADTSFTPQIANAESHLGQFAAAHRTIDRTPKDCISCLVARGDIDAREKKWDAAAFWFADAVKQAPDSPFAYSDWAAMLLRQGRYDDAITKFTLADQKGPRFADPLEMWGEALMLESRSDLALAKFEEADKYAPNWGRLHMKWGEALGYAGRKGEARSQYQTASTLDLSQADKAELARDMR